MNLNESVTEASSIINAAKDRIIAAIQELPGNKDATRINDRCFLLNSKFLNSPGFRLDPAYYDFKSAYDEIIAFIKRSTMLSLVPGLLEIIRTEYVGKRKIHPEVVKNFRTVLDKELDVENVKPH